LAIRVTWGSINIPEIRVIFTLGTSEDIQGFIIKEAKLYDDILQGDFPDTYANNIYKTVMTYQWIVDKCVNTSFYFLYVINLPVYRYGLTWLECSFRY
jgi:hypothetical protein